MPLPDNTLASFLATRVTGMSKSTSAPESLAAQEKEALARKFSALIASWCAKDNDQRTPKCYSPLANSNFYHEWPACQHANYGYCKHQRIQIEQNRFRHFPLSVWVSSQHQVMLGFDMDRKNTMESSFYGYWGIRDCNFEQTLLIKIVKLLCKK